MEELAAQGIGSITYPSGRVDTVEVAVRRAVITGTNQTNLKLREQFADEMECDLVEVSAHEGARPTHAEWQGKIYSRKRNDPRYPDFAASTGYGTGPGLGGWNCRHTFSAYFEGMPRAWSDEELEQVKNETVEYDGESMPRYEAQQRMRELERNVRKYRREAAVASGERAAGFLEKEREARARYMDFCKETGLKEQPERFKSGVLYNNFKKPSLKNAAGQNIIKVERTMLTSEPNTITEKTNSKGGKDRNYYGDDGRQIKQISNNGHGNKKDELLGKHGEHAHDYSYDEDGNLTRGKSRELTDEERRDNSDFL